jgi:pilus assembly protein Flp/PilA
MHALAKIQRFLTSEDGPTAVEYAVMLALILVAVITILQSLGTTVSSTFDKVNTTLSTANGS